MIHTLKFFTALLLAPLAIASAKDETVTTDLSVYWDASAPLANPHKGWYHHFYDNGLNKYLVKKDEDLTRFPGLDHVYLRLAWSYLEPEEGKFNWDVLDQQIEKWTRLGFGISFRISCKETGIKPVEQQFATPKWVKDAGAQGGYYARYNKPGDPAYPWEPVYDDPVFLKKLENFIRAFAQRYDGKPWLRYVDIGSLGDWGEGHTSSGSGINYDASARLQHLEIHTRYFKKTPLALSDDFVRMKNPNESEPLKRYVLEHGISYRDDSILVDYWTRQNGRTFSVANPELFEAVYLKMPTVLELEHLHLWATNGVWEGKAGTSVSKSGKTGRDFIRGAIQLMHATYIGYHGDAAWWLSLSGNPQFSSEMLNLCGYWYFPHNITRPVEFHLDATNQIAMTWENRGVAPAYHPYQLVFCLEGPDGCTITLDSNNQQWLPGNPSKTWTETYGVKLPNNLKPGDYTLSFRLYSPQEKRPVLLPLTPALKNADNFFRLGKIRVL